MTHRCECVHVCMHACVCVCVRDRERERDATELFFMSKAVFLSSYGCDIFEDYFCDMSRMLKCYFEMSYC